MASSSNKNPLLGQEDTVKQAILKAVESIRFGSVEVTVHDSAVVQIECKEKIRFESRRNRG